MERALERAHKADIVVLDLFASHSAAPGVLAALSRIRVPVRVVGASLHWKRLLRISRLDRRFHVLNQTLPLCPPGSGSGLQYVELQLGGATQ